MVVAAGPGPNSGLGTTDTDASDGRYHSENIRISFVSNPRSPTSAGRASRSKSSGDDAYVMSDHDIGMGTFSGSDKRRSGDSESRQGEGRVEGAEGEHVVGKAL